MFKTAPIIHKLRDLNLLVMQTLKRRLPRLKTYRSACLFIGEKYGTGVFLKKCVK
jgi:hypothetical protein